MGLRVPDSDKLQPTKPIEGSAYRLAQTPLRFLPDAPVKVEEIEDRACQQVISSFEREHVRLNV